jgi:hypothetical protein
MGIYYGVTNAFRGIQKGDSPLWGQGATPLQDAIRGESFRFTTNLQSCFNRYDF